MSLVPRKTWLKKVEKLKDMEIEDLIPNKELNLQFNYFLQEIRDSLRTVLIKTYLGDISEAQAKQFAEQLLLLIMLRYMTLQKQSEGEGKSKKSGKNGKGKGKGKGQGQSQGQGEGEESENGEEDSDSNEGDQPSDGEGQGDEDDESKEGKNKQNKAGKKSHKVDPNKKGENNYIDAILDRYKNPANKQILNNEKTNGRSGSAKSDGNNKIVTFDLEGLRKRRLSNTVETVFGKIAEDLAGSPIEGDDEWDVNELMKRSITKRLLNKCRQSRTKDNIVLILDTSGSCLPYSNFFSDITEAACRRKDVEIYQAPNAWVTHKYINGAFKDIDKENYNREYIWPFQNRHIIFFGDCDGLSHLKEASHRNKIWWFNCEDTNNSYWGGEHRNLKIYDPTNLKNSFVGKSYPCFNEEDFMKLVKKIKA